MWVGEASGGGLVKGWWENPNNKEEKEMREMEKIKVALCPLLLMCGGGGGCLSSWCLLFSLHVDGPRWRFHQCHPRFIIRRHLRRAHTHIYLKLCLAGYLTTLAPPSFLLLPRTPIKSAGHAKKKSIFLSSHSHTSTIHSLHPPPMTTTTTLSTDLQSLVSKHEKDQSMERVDILRHLWQDSKLLYATQYLKVRKQAHTSPQKNPSKNLTTQPHSTPHNISRT